MIVLERATEVLEVRGNLAAIQTAVDALRPGELLVVQPEFPEKGAEYFSRLLSAGAREITLDRAWANAVALTVD